MIARANLRQLDTVLRMSGGRNEDVAGLREQWKLLSEQASSPIPQLLNKVSFGFRRGSPFYQRDSNFEA